MDWTRNNTICKTWTGLICKTWTGLICKTWTCTKQYQSKIENYWLWPLRQKVATGCQIFKIWQPNIFFFSQYSISGFQNGRTVFFFTKYGSFSGYMKCNYFIKLTGKYILLILFMCRHTTTVAETSTQQ
jgi:hypothetical protein